LKPQGKTDDSGYAVLKFEIPADVKFDADESVDIKLIGTKDGLKISTSEYFDRQENHPFVYFMTDKPLYQPGQKIYVRGLAMRKTEGEAGMTIAAEKDFEFSVKDEENKTLFRQKVKTSRFGIAAIEWQIPSNAKLGQYKIEAADEEAERRGEAIFKVSRYDLPNFVVQTKSDKDFYLPTQNTAEVTVDALYLFGKPVAKGKVKVVQEGRRSWNY
jgi:alpha-2-macroglobulin